MDEYVPLDYAAIRRRLENKAGPEYWRSLEQLAQDPDFGTFFDAEFPGLAPEMDRRRFLQLMGASMALAGLAGCGGPPEKGVTYVVQPEKTIPGQAQWFASAVDFAGYAQPVLGRTHVGRPTKLEGNPDHPISRGAATAFTQASILQLYDPDRSQAPQFAGRTSSWDAFTIVAAEQAERFDQTRGQGLHLLMGASTSPTLQRQLAQLLKRWPKATIHRYEPWEGQRYAATEAAFGAPLETHHFFDRAEWVVSIDDDWLGPGPHELINALRWSERKRRAALGDGEARLFVMEALPTVTGAKATERRRIEAGQSRQYLKALAAALGQGSAPKLAAPEQQWIDDLAAGLNRRRGRCLVTVGPYAPLDVQAAVHALNQHLGNIGRTIRYTEPVQILTIKDQPLGDLMSLLAAIGQGSVETLVVLDGNPVYSAPYDLHVEDVLQQVPLRIHAGLYYNETASHCQWHLSMSHGLDGWGDLRAADGSVCLAQPLVQPFYATRTLSQILAMLMGDPVPGDFALVRQTWAELDEASWRLALERGFIQGSEFAAIEPPPAAVHWADDGPTVGASTAAESEPNDLLSVAMRPDPSVWDGRYANLGWLQELPKPISKLTWDNVITLSPRLAEQRGISNGDMLHVRVGNDSVSGPAWVMPGQADLTLGLFAGYGRWRCGRVGDSLGYNIAPMRAVTQPWLRHGAQLERLNRQYPLATTQPYHVLYGKELIRSLPLDEAYRPEPPQSELPTLYPPPPERPISWGMVIDLEQCIGCNACVIACQAENNIPIVGKEQVAAGRVMHWLRVDHYYKGDPVEPTSAFQPVPCMHCEQAPCEKGCPVNATVHGPEGLNEQIYNRCIGTRTCSSYCPYKVRRFNWFHWTDDDPPAIQAQRNPNVTVRSRGVMEKCTYCVQRISEARIDARMQDREVTDGEVQTACQQTCPTSAIVFGNIADPLAEVNRERHTRRHYALLGELNTRPKTTYLGIVERPPASKDEA